MTPLDALGGPWSAAGGGLARRAGARSCAALAGREGPSRGRGGRCLGAEAVSAGGVGGVMVGSIPPSRNALFPAESDTYGGVGGVLLLRREREEIEGRYSPCPHAALLCTAGTPPTPPDGDNPRPLFANQWWGGSHHPHHPHRRPARRRHGQLNVAAATKYSVGAGKRQGFPVKSIFWRSAPPLHEEYELAPRLGRRAGSSTKRGGREVVPPLAVRVRIARPLRPSIEAPVRPARLPPLTSREHHDPMLGRSR